VKIRPASSILLLAAVAGCSSILPKAPPEAFYDLMYEAERVDCHAGYGEPVEVWNFTAAGPYDRTDMVVTSGREVSLSRGHQWVDRPGVLVAQKLIRDLSGGRLFTVAVSPRDPAGAPLQLTGNLYRFAWMKDGGSAHASFEADVILRRTGAPAQVLLHNRYDLNSEPVSTTDDASAFARAMSGVVARFSALLRRDLCAAGRSVSGSTVPGKPRSFTRRPRCDPATAMRRIVSSR
jgi:ABC-type uncharacterized transport system auxiliary subunit